MSLMNDDIYDFFSRPSYTYSCYLEREEKRKANDSLSKQEKTYILKFFSSFYDTKISLYVTHILTLSLALTILSVIL